jgi:hypothetical protein
MALNITFAGYVYNNEGIIGNNNIAYQAYFYKSNSGSSSSKWNTKRIIESSGYYSCNLGDGDWLSQTGTASTGDIVLIVFWSPTSSERASTNISEWGLFRIILDSSSVYTSDAQTKINICPNISWSLPTTALVNDLVLASNSSNDTHQWNFNNNIMYQRDFWYTSLMSINSISNSVYNWGDSTSNSVVGANSYSHRWVTPGTYSTTLSITDNSGCTVSGAKNITITNNQPIPDITMTPSNPNPNETVSFRYSGTDANNTITNISWTINDSTNTIKNISDRDDIIYHENGLGTQWYNQSANVGAFTLPGGHIVSIEVSWWDGFNTQIKNFSKTFFQNKFSGPTINFYQSPDNAKRGEVVYFNNITSNIDRVGLGLPDHIEYTWYWLDDTKEEIIEDVNKDYILQKIPTTTSCSVALKAEWSDGWDTIETILEKDVVFDVSLSFIQKECYYNLNMIGTSDDGTITAYKWNIYYGGSSIGPWVEQWASPLNIDQNDKDVCFTTKGWYKIVGAIHGTTSSVSKEYICHILDECPPSIDKRVVAICPPGINTRHSEFIKQMQAVELKPGLKTNPTVQSVPNISYNFKSPFPSPINL